VRRPLHTLKIWGAGVNSPRSYRAEFVFFGLSVFLSRYDARHRKPRRFVYALKLGGTGISPPDTFSFRFSFRFRSRFRSRSSSSSTTSGDIFYCSGSRQLNHSSCIECNDGAAAANRNMSKYADLPATHIFQPLAFETHGANHSSALDFLNAVWVVVQPQNREIPDKHLFFGNAFWFIQRFNAILISETFFCSDEAPDL